MAHFRFSGPAQQDLTHILSTSGTSWGREGRRCYATLIAAAMRKIAADPEGPVTRARGELLPGLRSFHIRHARGKKPKARVKNPVHVVYYRTARSGVIEIVRVLHERMDPALHVEQTDKPGRAP